MIQIPSRCVQSAWSTRSATERPSLGAAEAGNVEQP